MLKRAPARVGADGPATAASPLLTDVDTRKDSAEKAEAAKAIVVCGDVNPSLLRSSVLKRCWRYFSQCSSKLVHVASTWCNLDYDVLLSFQSGGRFTIELNGQDVDFQQQPLNSAVCRARLVVNSDMQLILPKLSISI